MEVKLIAWKLHKLSNLQMRIYTHIPYRTIINGNLQRKVHPLFSKRNLSIPQIDCNTQSNFDSVFWAFNPRHINPRRKTDEKQNQLFYYLPSQNQINSNKTRTKTPVILRSNKQLSKRIFNQPKNSSSKNWKQ